jgi:hypothetical protein
VCLITAFLLLLGTDSREAMRWRFFIVFEANWFNEHCTM